MSELALETAIEIAKRLQQGLSTVIRGRADTVQLAITTLLAEGHLLLEDYPGSGKTTLAKTLGRLIDCNASSGKLAPFRRIQFTPDLLPGDVLGVNVFEPKEGNFRFVAGPVFAHIVLADEINRAGPKVQSAFLECMAERQVTLDNATYPLDELFFVIGTQNPLDIAGTYPLPIVQLDRFMAKAPMSYVDAKTELEILNDHDSIEQQSRKIDPVCTRDEVVAARRAIRNVKVVPALREAIVTITQATRENRTLLYKASTRAALMLQAAVRACAVVNGRNYATEDDLKAMLVPVLLHRLKFNAAVQDPATGLREIAGPAFEKLARSI